MKCNGKNLKPQTKEKVEAKVEKAAADTVDKITKNDWMTCGKW